MPDTDKAGDNDQGQKSRPVRSALAFAFMPQFRWNFPVVSQNLQLIRPLLLIPLVCAGLLPQSALGDEIRIRAHIGAAFGDLVWEVKNNNWQAVLRKAPALLAVVGLIVFCLASLITFVASLVLSPAHAQDISTLFEAPGKAQDLISSIFGSNNGGATSGGTTSSGPAGNIFQGTLGKMLFVYNSGMMAFALIILIYQWLYLIVATAQDKEGEAGGKKSDLTWFIIRSLVAIALITPLSGVGSGTGFSGGQMIVIGLGNMGSSFASKVWAEFSEATIKTGRPISTPRPPAEIDQLVAKLLIVEACTVSANIMAARAGDAPYIEVVQTTTNNVGVSSTGVGLLKYIPTVRKQTLINYDGRTGALYQRACGQVRFPVANNDQDTITTPIIQAQKNAFVATRPAIINLARELSAHFIPGMPEYGTPMPNPGQLLKERGIVTTWHNNILSAIENARSQNEAILNQSVSRRLAEDGWVAAGSWFQTIANVNGQFIDAVGALPSVTLPLNSVSRKVPVTGNVLAGLTVWWDDYSSDSSLSSVVRRTTTPLSGSDGSGLWDLLQEYFDLHEVILGFVEADGTMPLADLSAIGHLLLNIGESGFAILFGASLIPLVNGVILNFVGLGLLALIVPGATLAIWLPLLPFIRFVFGILTWLLNLLEAVVLCPLFLIAHLGTGGSGLYTSTTQAGYNLLLQLILRPVLMVIGLIAGLLIFNSIIGLFNDYFYPAIISANNGSSSGIIKGIFYIILYCITAYGLANAAFKAIDILPERVLEWIGGRGASHMDGTSSAGRQASGGSSKLEGLAGNARGIKKFGK